MDINNHLLELANKLDKEDNIICANAVDSLLSSNSLVKTAQYVGVIGYVLKQNRAMCNCIRKKRASQDGSMQEVILDCLKEYQDGQDYHNTDWTSKYAQVIKSYPESFDVAHLSFLHELGGEFVEHINKVREATQTLHNNKMKDELIDSILSHAEQLGTILKKEADSSLRPFKVAATPERSRWSKFWNPSEQNWNPMSWSAKGRGRGEDMEMDNEIDYILSELVNISNISQSMKRSISKLQSEVEHNSKMPYSGPNDLTARATRSVYNRVKNLDPNDWNVSIREIAKLENVISAHKATTSDPLLYDKVIKLKQQMNEDKGKINDSLDDIRETTYSLRKREGMTGRRSPGYAGQGSAIIKEFNRLNQALGLLEKDPLDEKSQTMTQEVINRLNMILDPKALGDDDYESRMEGWMNPSSADPVPTADPTVADDPSTPQNISQNLSDSDTSKASSIASEITKRTGDQKIAKDILTSIVGAQLELLNNNPALKNLLIEVIANLGNSAQSVTPPATPVQPTPTPQSTFNLPAGAQDNITANQKK